MKLRFNFSECVIHTYFQTKIKYIFKGRFVIQRTLIHTNLRCNLHKRVCIYFNAFIHAFMLRMKYIFKGYFVILSKFSSSYFIY